MKFYQHLYTFIQEKSKIESTNKKKFLVKFQGDLYIDEDIDEDIDEEEEEAITEEISCAGVSMNPDDFIVLQFNTPQKSGMFCKYMKYITAYQWDNNVKQRYDYIQLTDQNSQSWP